MLLRIVALTFLLTIMPHLAWAIPGYHINDDESAKKAVQQFADDPYQFSGAVYQAALDKNLWRIALAAYDYLKQKPGDPKRECSFATAFWQSQQGGVTELVPLEAKKRLSSLYEEAVKDTKDAAKKDPKSVQAHLTYGRYLEYFVMGMQKVPDMLHEFEAAVKLKSDVGYIHMCMGEAYMDDGDTGEKNVDKAIAEFKKAIALDKRQTEAYVHLAGLYGWPCKNDFVRSKAYLNKYLKARPDQANRIDIVKMKEYLDSKTG